MTSRQISAALFFCFVGATFACVPDSTSQPAVGGVHYLDDRDNALIALKRVDSALTLREHPTLQTVASLEFSTPARITYSGSTSIGTATRDFILRYRPLFGLGTADALETRDSTTDRLGRRRITYVQKRFGVTVWGSQLDAHLRGISAASAELVRLSGHLIPLPLYFAASSQPTLSTEDARQLALATARGRSPAADLAAYVPALYYLAQRERLNLVYRVEVYGQLDGLPQRAAYFIDAHDGDVHTVEDLVARIDMTVPAQGSGTGALGTNYTLSISQRGDTFSLQDPTRGSQRTTRVSPSEKLPGRTVSSGAADTWDDHPVAPGLAVDIHAHLATLWDYFAARHGYYGFDGAGHGVVAVAHLGDHANAALSDDDRVLFGDGDGRDYAPLGAALDIVAHEYVHAVTRANANLAVSGESGAIDEAFADLLACLIERSVRPQNQNWTVGEEIYHPGGQPGALANLEDPRSPSGALGHAGYLLAQSQGEERTAAIAFRAITTYLFRYAELADAADALRAAARDLYDEDAVNAVTASLRRAGL